MTKHIIFLFCLLFFLNIKGQTVEFLINGERIGSFGKNSDMVSMSPIFKLENNTIHNKNKSLEIVKLPQKLKSKTLAYGFLFFTGNRNSNFKNEVVFLVENYDSNSPIIYIDSNGNLDFTDDTHQQTFKEKSIIVKLKNEFKPSGYLSYQLNKSEIIEKNSSRLMNRFKQKYPKSKLINTKYWFTNQRLSVNISKHTIHGSPITILGYDGNADGLLKFDSSEYGDRIAIIDKDLDLNEDFTQYIRLGEPINYDAVFKIGSTSYQIKNINSDASFLELIRSDKKVDSKIGIYSDIADLNFSLLNGEKLSIKDLMKKGKPILLNFGATWCGGCIQQEKTIKELYKTEKISIIGLFPDDNKESVLSYASKKNIKWPVGLLSKELKKQLHINAYPTFMLISTEGKIIKIDMDSENIKKYVLIN